MKRPSESWHWKRTVKIALGAVLVLDLALVAAIWSSMRNSPQAQAEKRDRLAQKTRLLTSDVARGAAIEARLPLVNRECDTFYKQDLLPGASGYAIVVADFGEMARNAGVATSGINFGQREAKEGKLSEVRISAQVEGNYQGLIRFISDLEQSQHFYVLDQLTLSSAKSGNIKLNLSLRTYFRT